MSILDYLVEPFTLPFMTRAMVVTVIAAVVFAVLLLITLSYSGRGIVRPDHAPEAFDDEEAKLLKEYNSRHGQ